MSGDSPRTAADYPIEEREHDESRGKNRHWWRCIPQKDAVLWLRLQGYRVEDEAEAAKEETSAGFAIALQRAYERGKAEAATPASGDALRGAGEAMREWITTKMDYGADRDLARIVDDWRRALAASPPLPEGPDVERLRRIENALLNEAGYFPWEDPNGEAWIHEDDEGYVMDRQQAINDALARRQQPDSREGVP